MYLNPSIILHKGFTFFTRSEGTTLIKYKIPTRGLLGLRNAILTASRGTAILNTIFDSYGPWAGEMSTRDQGSLVIIALAFFSLVQSLRSQEMILLSLLEHSCFRVLLQA